MPSNRTIEVGWQHEDVDYRVICTVGKAEPGRRYMPDGSPGWPAEPGEVEILEVVEDLPYGQKRPDLIPAAQADFARIEERARQEADGVDDAAREDAEERRADAARDERRLS